MSVVQDGRIYIELINGPFLFREKGTPEEYKAGLDLAIERREAAGMALQATARGQVYRTHNSIIPSLVSAAYPCGGWRAPT